MHLTAHFKNSLDRYLPGMLGQLPTAIISGAVRVWNENSLHDWTIFVYKYTFQCYNSFILYLRAKLHLQVIFCSTIKEEGFHNWRGEEGKSFKPR